MKKTSKIQNMKNWKSGRGPTGRHQLCKNSKKCNFREAKWHEADGFTPKIGIDPMEGHANNIEK